MALLEYGCPLRPTHLADAVGAKAQPGRGRGPPSAERREPVPGPVNSGGSAVCCGWSSPTRGPCFRW